MSANQVHYELFDAARFGDTKRFSAVLPYATHNDKEWAMEVASNISIVKHLIENENITGFHRPCYLRAIYQQNWPIIEYFHSRNQQYFLDEAKKTFKYTGEDINDNNIDINQFHFNEPFDLDRTPGDGTEANAEMCEMMAYKYLRLKEFLDRF